jgi:hypothetical protein
LDKLCPVSVETMINEPKSLAFFNDKILRFLNLILIKKMLLYIYSKARVNIQKHSGLSLNKNKKYQVLRQIKTLILLIEIFLRDSYCDIQKNRKKRKKSI